MKIEDDYWGGSLNIKEREYINIRVSNLSSTFSRYASDIICCLFHYLQMKIITRQVKHAFVLFQIILVDCLILKEKKKKIVIVSKE